MAVIFSVPSMFSVEYCFALGWMNLSVLFFCVMFDVVESRDNVPQAKERLRNNEKHISKRLITYVRQKHSHEDSQTLHAFLLTLAADHSCR